MSKRMCSFFLALIMCFGMAATALAAPAGYSDVPESHWAAASVSRATELNLFQGVSAGQFGLGQPITRAAFVTALGRLFRWESVTPQKASFTDVQTHRWYYTAVETALANGALTAAGKTFRPTEYITREEMAVMLVRALGYASLAGNLSREASPFTDVVTNRGFITLAYDLGIMGGIGSGKFAPEDTASREQAAAVLVRVYEKLYAASMQVPSAEGLTVLSVPTPQANAAQEIPTTPLEPMADLYAALRKASRAGSDMGSLALVLTAGGMRTVLSGSQVVDSQLISAREVTEVLEKSSTRPYYSDRYESAYCLYPMNNSYQEAVLWYQSEESLSAKLQLARLFGVTCYVLQDLPEETEGK